MSLIPNGSTEIKPVKLLPVGPAYLAHVRRSIHNHSFEEHDKHEEERRKRVKNDEGDANEDDLGVGDEEEPPELLALDPKEWKVSRILVDFGSSLRCARSNSWRSLLTLSANIMMMCGMLLPLERKPKVDL